ncbi:hypothetical protein [Nocardia sp. NPDC006630]|uniref:hypothetical protein n=1 Tax=Nocardia sp. NPDC006630 TaxID=3157181 RepID=UPI0033A10845
MIRKIAAAAAITTSLLGAGAGIAQAESPTVEPVAVQPVAAGQNQSLAGEQVGTVVGTVVGVGVGAVVGGAIGCVVVVPVCPATTIIGIGIGGVTGGALGATLGAGAGAALGAQIPG